MHSQTSLDGFCVQRPWLDMVSDHQITWSTPNAPFHCSKWKSNPIARSLSHSSIVCHSSFRLPFCAFVRLEAANPRHLVSIRCTKRLAITKGTTTMIRALSVPISTSFCSTRIAFATQSTAFPLCFRHLFSAQHPTLEPLEAVVFKCRSTCSNTFLKHFRFHLFCLFAPSFVVLFRQPRRP